MTWVLILTAMRYTGVALTNIPDFATAAECQQAGNEWLRQMEVTGNGKYFNLRAICVRRTDAP